MSHVKNNILKDLDDDSTFYFEVSKQLSYPEFVAVIKNLRNNIAAEKTNFDAALAALVDVCFLGAFRCDNALPAAVLDVLLVELLVSVLDAFVAAFLPVTFLLVMRVS